MAKGRNKAGYNSAACPWILLIKLILFILKITLIGCMWYLRLLMFIMMIVPLFIKNICTGGK